MRLFIAEKPELAAAIVQGLAQPARKHQGYIEVGADVVTWCFGHMLALCDPEDYDPALKAWTMASLPLVFRPWKLKPIDKSKSQLAVIVKLLKQAHSVVHAGDPDDEGQLLVDEILTYTGNTKPVQRLLINDNNTKVVQKALASMRDNREFFGLYQSALARSVADQLFGYNLTRAYTLSARAKGYQGVLSVGRVQTPILGLVVNRDRAHESHQSQSYLVLHAAFGEQPIRTRYQHSEQTPVNANGHLTDTAFAQQVVQACVGQTGRIESLRRQPKSLQPPLPYNLLKLQADANRLYQIDLDDTLSITQALREKHRLITYNRSDCQYLSDEHHEDAPQVLQAIRATMPSLANAIAHADPGQKSPAFDSSQVSAHHGIIPTETVVAWEQLTQAEQRIYGLIARAYVAQFLPLQVQLETRVVVECAGHHFVCSSKQTTTEGWSILYPKQDAAQDPTQKTAQEASDPEDQTLQQELSGLVQGQQHLCQAVKIEQRLTQPPKRYTKASLLEDLSQMAKYVTDPRIKQLLLAKDAGKASEQGGIGTPATRSSIIKGLQDRGFLQAKGRYLISTEIGRQFFGLLPASCSSADMTALWHEQQRRIAANEYRVDQFLDHLVTFLRSEIDRLNQEGLPIEIKRDGPRCPTCSEGYLNRRKGSKGMFWGCDQYPRCKATFVDQQGKPVLDRATIKAPASEHACGACGLPLSRRAAKTAGRFWWGCTGYPNCRQTYFDRQGLPDFDGSKAS